MHSRMRELALDLTLEGCCGVPSVSLVWLVLVVVLLLVLLLLVLLLSLLLLLVVVVVVVEVVVAVVVCSLLVASSVVALGEIIPDGENGALGEARPLGVPSRPPSY